MTITSTSHWLDQVLPQVDVPEGRSGPWSVERFTVSETQAGNFNCNPRVGRRQIRAGTYTRLTQDGHVVMSDVPAERHDHLGFVREAHGDVLVTGLGLGMVVQACLLKPEVRKVTVVEIDPDVIGLVAPHHEARWGERFEVVQADAFTWAPPKGLSWDSGWHDVWPDITPENLDGMTRLKRRFARRVPKAGCWAEYECRMQAGRR